MRARSFRANSSHLCVSCKSVYTMISGRDTLRQPKVCFRVRTFAIRSVVASDQHQSRKTFRINIAI